MNCGEIFNGTEAYLCGECDYCRGLEDENPEEFNRHYTYDSSDKYDD